MKYTMKDFIEQRIAVNCRTNDERDAFLELCEAHGLRWRSGVPPTRYIPTTNYGDQLCIACESAWVTERKLCYCGARHFSARGWKVVSFSDLASAKKPGNHFCIVIECSDDKTTTAELIKGGKTVKRVEAKCNPADKFNIRIGAQTAFDRLWERSAE